MMSDPCAGFATILVLVLRAAGALEIWHLYITAAITGLFGSFQWPAYSASISLMAPKEQLGLQMVFFLGNLFAGIGFTVLAPMILSRTGNSEIVFGPVQTAG